MSRWPSVRAASCSAVTAWRCGAPTRNAPKSPALWESGRSIAGIVPSWPMNGRIRATTPTRSDGANSRIGFWIELPGSAAACAASCAKASACSRADRHAEPAGVVEGHRVAVGERERRRRRAALGAAHGVLADPLDDRRLVLGAALRADLRAVRIAVEAPLDHAVVARRRRHRRHVDRADPDGDRVADLGALDVHRQRHLVAALDRGRDHRPPAAGRGVRDDRARRRGRCPAPRRSAR